MVEVRADVSTLKIFSKALGVACFLTGIHNVQEVMINTSIHGDSIFSGVRRVLL